MEQRLNFIDLTKGFCMLMVISLHIGGIGINKQIFINSFWLFLLPCFFILSGYFYSPNLSFKQLFLKKTKSLLVPYILFLIPVYIYNILYYYLHPSTTLSDAFTNSAVHNDPLWFIFSLYLMSLLSFFICKITKSVYKLLLFTTLISIIGVVLRNEYIDIKYTNSLEYLIYFLIGYLWKIYNISQLTKKQLYLSLICFLAIAIPFQINANFAFLCQHSPLYFIGAVSGSIVLIYTAKKIGNLPLINFIGENSLICLVCHMYFLFLLNRGLHISNPWVLLVGCILLLYPTIYCINIYFPWIIGKKQKKKAI